jgi:hypothetical protein
MSRSSKFALSLIIAGLAILMAGCGGHSTTQAQTYSHSMVPVLVQQPASAQSIAAKVGCGNFQDSGPSKIGGAIDSGTCTINGQQYGVDTFVNSTIRDSWLAAAESLGVVPKWETSTSVIYSSTDK